MIRFIFTNRPDQHRRDREQDERRIPIRSWNHPPRSSTELDPSLNTHPILLSIRPTQPPSASAVFLLHLPESAARSSPSIAYAGRSLCSGKALRDWDLCGPFFFIVFLGLMLSWSPSVKKAKASLDSGLLLAFDLTQRTDSHLMSMIRYAINHILKFTIKCCSHSEVFAVAFALLAAVAVILTLNVKLGELEADLFAIKAINDNLYPSYNELVEFRGHIESGREPENYLKYSVEDIKIIDLDFFEE
ncbi:unnamed protein product [Brassica oleracea]